MTRAVRWMGEIDGEPVILFYRQISLMADEEHHALLEMLPPHEATIKVRLRMTNALLSPFTYCITI